MNSCMIQCPRCQNERDLNDCGNKCGCEKCLVCLRWFIDVDNHVCDGGHCDRCNCFVLDRKNHYCPMNEKGVVGDEEQDWKKQIEDQMMVVVQCFECSTMMDQSQMYIWKENKLCSNCFYSQANVFEREHNMVLIRSGFYQRLPTCAGCESLLTYCWDIEHQIKKLVDQGEEDLAQTMIDDHYGSFHCLSCLTNKHQYRYGDDCGWVCEGNCKEAYCVNLFMDEDCVKKTFAGKHFCIACYTNDRQIRVAIKLIKKVILSGLEEKCAGCFEEIIVHDLCRIYQFDNLFGLSLEELIAQGDVLQIVKKMSGMKELCEKCWVNLQNVADVLGISHDRRRILMARTRRIFHPQCHPDVEVIISRFESELRKTKRYQMFENIFKKPPTNGKNKQRTTL